MALSDEDLDQDLQQDIAAAAAQAAGINMDSYDFGGFDPGGSDSSGASNQGVIDSIVGSYMDNPSRTGMAIRESFPMFKSPKAGLDQFVNLYTSRRGPISRADSLSLYDRNRSNPGGVDTSGYDSVKAAQRLGIGSGQIKTNADAGRLPGTVFKDGVVKKGDVFQGVPADIYYGDRKDTENEYAGLPRYTDKGYLGADGVPYANPAERALNRAYDQYLNPLNIPGEPGYNPDIDPNVNPQAFDLRGQVRPGLQSGIFSRRDGTPTALGPIATYDRNYSGMDNIAMGVTGGMGMLARALTNKVTGIAGQPLPQDAMAPTPEMIARGETYGGLGRSFAQIPEQAVQGFKDAGSALQNVIDDFTTPNVPGVSTSSLDFMPRGASPDLAGFEQRFGGTNPLSGETTVKTPESLSTVDTFSLGPLQGPPQLIDQSTSPLNMDISLDYPGTEFDTRVRGSFSETGGTMDDARERALQQAFQTPGEKLAGLDTLGAAIGRGSVKLDPSVQDFLDKYGMSIKDLMDKNFENIPNGAVLPSGQIMSDELRPEKSSFVPAPDIMQLIRDATAARELGGPLTANQLAFDATNMVRDGNTLTSKYNTPSTFDKFVSEVGIAPILRSMGMKIKKGPTAKIYDKESPSFFSRLIGAS